VLQSVNLLYNISESLQYVIYIGYVETYPIQGSYVETLFYKEIIIVSVMNY